MSGEWRTEVHYQPMDNDEEIVTHLKWGPCTPEWGKKYAQIDVEYCFFDTEEEAAKAFLQDVAEYPEARYHQSQYQDALKVVQQGQEEATRE